MHAQINQGGPNFISSHAQIETDGSSSPGPISMEEEALLLQFSAGSMQGLVQRLQLPRKVAMTALVLLRRFYLSKSVLEAEPSKFVLTSIYVACKAEESYFSAEDFCRTLERDPAVVLQNELTLLQGLSFDLVVHNPLWALRGHLMLFDEWRHDDASGAPPQLRSLSSSAMRGAAEAAQAALLSTAATDAVLLVPPGALALAALRIGFDQSGVDTADFVQHVAARSSVPVETLDGSVDAVQQLYELSVQRITKDQVEPIDRKIKVYKKRRQKRPTA
mmetsp:Transcript_20021/g.60510  ORF Transcript_20021/g.60510 Transcript_20021/m.60510 type:complete len:276 (-) Transcript_20021:1464-2291(-)